MKLKPKRATIELEYECPYCGSAIFTEDKTACQIGKVVCWSCENIVEFEPFRTILRFGSDQQKGVSSQKTKRQHKPNPSPANKQPQNEKNPLEDDIVKLLMSLGHKKGEAQSLVKTGIESGLDINNPEKFVEGLMVK